jgi:hypothetical protein
MPASHELHHNKSVSWLWEVEGLVLQRVSSVRALMLCFIAYKFGTLSGYVKKKKVDVENRQFQDNWMEDYYFILNKGWIPSSKCSTSKERSTTALSKPALW